MRWRLRCPRPAGQCPVSLQAPPAGPSSERVLLHSPKPSSSLQHLPGPGSLHLSLVGLVCLLFCLALSWGRECRGSVRIWSPIKVHKRIFQQALGSRCPRSTMCLLGSGALEPSNRRPKASSAQFSSVAQSCPTLCNPMNRSTPGLPVYHQLLDFTQTHIRVSDAMQPSHPLSSLSPPAPNPSQHQSLFQ